MNIYIISMVRTQAMIEAQKRYRQKNPSIGVNSTRKWRHNNCEKMSMYRKKAYYNQPHILDYHIFQQYRKMFNSTE